MLILIAGTSSSGKSEYAERRLVELAGSSSRRVYLATSEVHDSETRTRIARHKLRRSTLGFVTLEQTRDLGRLGLHYNDCVLLESLTSLTANEMFTHDGINHDAGRKIFSDILSIYERVKHLLIVSDDIFSDGVSYDSLTDEYLRTLAALHVKLAEIAQEVTECFAGLVINYK